jgi:type IV secretory pathway VirB2 component (pilin)
MIPFGFLFAQTSVTPPNAGSVTPPNPTPSQSFKIKIETPFKGISGGLEGFILTIIDKIVLPIGGIVAVLMIMYAGFLYVTAGGDTGKIKLAHTALLYAVIGSAILLGAKVISTVIQGTISQLK